MTPKKSALLILAVLSIFTRLPAQVSTNNTALRLAATRSAARHQEMAARLLRLSAQNGWPLYISMRGGNRAMLYSVDPRGLPLYVATNDNIISAATIGTNQLWPGGSTGINLNGSSAALKGRIAIWDGGKVRSTHQELVGRVVQKDGVTALNDHSTHVSGTLVAAGVNPAARGMSFGAQQLLAYDFDNDVTEMLAAAPDLLISNHSYGTVAGWNFNTDKNRWEFLGDPGDTADYKFGYYDEQAQAWDSIAYNAPFYLIVKSVGNNRDVNGPAVGQPYFRPNAAGAMISAGKRPAGISSNDGYDIVPTYGNAKNILDVGAVNPIPAGYSRPADVVLAEFSSWGPTDDGRIKPELVADGVNVLSSISTADNAYAIYSGTSMSSPAAAGSSFLLQEYYAKLHAGAFMRSATLKGLLIHTADEAGPSDGPDYQFGYGLIDMPRAASVIKSGNTDQLILENNLSNGASFSLPVIASGKGPLVVTLSWTDPAGKVDEVNILNNPARKLVNDLDLRVSGNSTSYTPWILDRRNPGNPATNGDDTLNNVEKIQISNTIPGKTYTISVTHKGSLQKGAQAYSLIASGVGGQGYCSSAASSPAGTRIDQVIIDNDSNSVSNPPGCSTYTDHSDKIIHLQSQRPASFSIKLSSCDASTAQRVVKVYIDYNNNGSFTDSGEMVLVSPVLAGGSLTWSSGSFTVPSGIQTGSSTLLRIVAEETTDTAAVKPCGSYANGETEDYRVQFAAPSNDVGMGAVVDPLPGFCQADSERISVRIKNIGTADQENFPVSLRVTSGGSAILDLTTIFPDTVSATGNAIYTFQSAFKAEAGKTYVVTVSTKLSGDQDTTNNTVTDTITVSAGSASSVTGVAEICSENPDKAGLKANISDSSDAILWYDSPEATEPIASGPSASTNVIPANKTYYLGVNDLSGSVGPKSKMEFPSGGYNFFQNNFLRFSNEVPLTISSARLYVGNGGKVTFMVADLASFDSCSGNYSYYLISSNTIDVYPTTPNPQPGAVTGNPASDTGAVFLLNLSVPTPGNHVLIVIAEDGATLFRNNNITTNHYPFGIPGVFSITGNGATDCTNANLYQSYYYFLYDLKLSLNKCASPRIPVPAKSPEPALITLTGNLLSSNYASGNQWYFNDTLIAGATLPTDSAFIPGNYKDVILDSLGCPLVSNEIAFSTGNGIDLKTLPNPSNGAFKLQFYVANSASTSVSVVNMLGQKIYQADYPAFAGLFNKTINLGAVGAGLYVLKVQVGGDKYVKKIMVY